MTAAGNNKDVVFALDQGGHASRVFVVGLDGKVVFHAHRDIGTQVLAADQVEHDPLELVASFKHCLRAAEVYCGQHNLRVVAAGLATQRSSIVCWDRRDGAPLSPVLSWQDRRNSAWLEGFQQYKSFIHQRTGLYLTAHYGASKLRWCQENLPAVAAAQQSEYLAWGPLAAFLVFHLVRGHPFLVDPVNASRTLLWSLQTMDWDPELLNLFGLDAASLPQCTANAHDYGFLDLAARDVPLLLLTGDQSAAMFAYGTPDIDAVYVNIGTGAFVQRVYWDAAVYAPNLLKSVVYRGPRELLFALEGTVNGAGSALVRMEQELAIDAQVAQRDFPQWMKSRVPPPLFLNGISGLGSPYWRPQFNSRFVGDGSAEDKLVAVAESILFLIRVNLDEMRRHFTAPTHVMITGGFANNSELCQRLANLLEIPVHRPEQVEATALGLAWLLARDHGRWCVGSAKRVYSPVQDQGLAARYQAWLACMSEAMV